MTKQTFVYIHHQSPLPGRRDCRTNVTPLTHGTIIGSISVATHPFIFRDSRSHTSNPIGKDTIMSFRTQAQQLAIDSDNDSPLLKLFQQSKPIIHSIAKRYCNLDRSYEIEDLEQIGFLAVRKATEKWDFSRGNAQFQTFLYRYIQKAYQSEFDGRDKLVEITDKDDQYVKTLPYSTFVKEKRRLHSQGFKSRIFRRLVPLTTHEPPVVPDASAESFAQTDVHSTDDILGFHGYRSVHRILAQTRQNDPRPDCSRSRPANHVGTVDHGIFLRQRQPRSPGTETSDLCQLIRHGLSQKPSAGRWGSMRARLRCPRNPCSP
jgi:DNA-directed RNA polymerase specialized sigma24 family protein